MRLPVFLALSLTVGCEAPAATQTPEAAAAPSTGMAVEPPPQAPQEPTPELASEPVPEAAPAPRDESARARANQLLAGAGYVPDASAVKSLGPGAFQALVSIAGDENSPAEVRARALTSISYLGDGHAGTELRLALRSFKGPLLTRTALFALARVQGRAAVPDLLPYLGDPNPTLRLAAAETLGRLGGTAARTALLQRRDLETDRTVREAIGRALGK